MASVTLTKGISFRRQGSSGLTWADTWTVTEEGVLAIKRPKEDKTKDFTVPQFRTADPRDTSSTSSVLDRSKSVGNSPRTKVRPHMHHKSASGIVKWLKKTFTKPKT
eukprot:c21678_g1_i1 orf=857-1177(+)